MLGTLNVPTNVIVSVDGPAACVAAVETVIAFLANAPT